MSLSKARLCSALLALSAWAAPALAADPMVTIVAAPSPAQQGQGVDISVMVSDISDLYGYNFSLSFDASVLKAEVPVLVEFGATWCGPCRALEPMLTKLAAKHAGSKVVTVDVDDSPGLATQYGVRGVPTVIVFAKGKEVARQVGLAAESRFASMMDAAKV